MDTYAARNELLKQLGYDSYADYLKSPLWHDIKRRAFAHHGSNCLLCPKRAEVIHHVCYDEATLKGESILSLAPVCRICHCRIELRKDGTKRYLNESQGFYWNARRIRIRKLENKAGVRHVKQKKNYCQVCGCRARKWTKFCRNHTPKTA